MHTRWSRSKLDAARLREASRYPGAIRLTANVVLSACGHLPACWASSAIVAPAPHRRARAAHVHVRGADNAECRTSITAIIACRSKARVHQVGTGRRSQRWKCVSNLVRRIPARTTRVIATQWDSAIIRRGAENRRFGTAAITERAACAWIRKRQRGVVARRKGCARTVGAFGSLRRAGTAAYVWMGVTRLAGGNGNRPGCS